MIKTEILTINGQLFVKSYSTEGFMLRKIGTNEIYEEAIDPINKDRTYEEIDEPLEDETVLL